MRDKSDSLWFEGLYADDVVSAVWSRDIAGHVQAVPFCSVDRGAHPLENDGALPVGDCAERLDQKTGGHYFYFHKESLMLHSSLPKRASEAGFIAVLILTLVSACASEVPVSESSSAATADDGVQVFSTSDYEVRVVTVAEGLSHPYCFAFLPDGGILVTEQDGQLRLIRDGVLVPEPIAGVPEVQAGTGGGFMDIALHPDFAENNWVYFTYTKPIEGGVTTAIGRGRFDGSELGEVTDIFVADALSTTRGHLSSRIGFGPDNTLYLTVSDVNLPEQSQDIGDHIGKVMRIRDDGSVPDDNPFVGQSGYRPEIFTLGHRNLHGVAFHPETGAPYTVEHGDEVNMLQPGGNYGWPFVSSGEGEPVLEAPEGTELTAPIISWFPVLNIAGITFYTGDRFPEWQGDLFVGGLRTEQLRRVFIKEDGSADSEPVFTDIGGRVKDVRQGPDGLIYFATDAPTGGRFTAETEDAAAGRILRIEPAG